MPAFDSIRSYFHKREVQKKLKLGSLERELKPFTEIERIGILYDSTNQDSIDPVRKFRKAMERKKKKVGTLGYIDANNAGSSLQFNCFTRKDLDWRFIPSGFMVEDFLNKEYDLLINAYLIEKAPLNYISIFSQSKFRIGSYFPDNTLLSDMMVTINGSPNLDDFFIEVSRCLNIYYGDDDE